MSDAKKKYETALSEIKKKSPDIPLVLSLLNESMEAGYSEAPEFGEAVGWFLLGF
jgi:hypothetical protein